MNGDLISIIIPTYNEEKNIAKLILQIIRILEKKHKSEIIIVDDSFDKTAETIKKKFKSDKRVRLFVRKKKGLASAILFGLNKTKGDRIVNMDADFNHPPELIPKLIEGLKKADLIIASRFVKGGGMEKKGRYFFTFVFNYFLKYFLGFPATDNTSGFYAIKKDTLLKFPVDRIYRGYGDYHLRLVYNAKKEGLRIKEIPVFYKKRLYGESKSNLIKMFFRYLKVAIWLKINNGEV